MEFYLCDRCQHLEEIALRPSGSRTVEFIDHDDKVCFSCLGLLQTFVSPEFIEAVCGRISEQGFQHKYIRSSLLLPSCLFLRQHLIVRKQIGDKGLAGVDLRVCLLKRMSFLKAAWRELVVPHLEKRLGISHLDGDGSSNTTPFFDVLLTFDYAYNDLEVNPLHAYFPKRLQHVKALKRPVEEFKNSLDIPPNKNLKASQFTLLAVMDAICSIPMNETDFYFASIEKEISSHPIVPMSLQTKPVFASQAIYVHGRYRKMCRDLPQSAWTAEDDDDDVIIESPMATNTHCNPGRYKTSIEQLLGEPLMKYTGADSYRFSAAGREDVDVRMLGSGRPFCIQLCNPRTPFAITESSMAVVNLKRIFEDSKLELFDLKETMSRIPVDMLKVAEGQKEKEYTAVCFIRNPSVPIPSIETICEKLSSTPCPITLKQKTPIRVLHRRSPVARVRHILKIHAEPFKTDSTRYAFSLRLRTEAGTYVKEFVHGDFGRTCPNIAQLINQDWCGDKLGVTLDVDIVTLDVTDISDTKTVSI